MLCKDVGFGFYVFLLIGIYNDVIFLKVDYDFLGEEIEVVRRGRGNKNV